MRKLQQCLSLVVVLSVVGLRDEARGNLIAHYTFDETGGTTAHDAIGAVDGTLQGAATFAPGAGIQGGAISLNRATGDLVNMGDHFGFTSGDASIQAWVKLNADDTVVSIPISRHFSGITAGYFLAINDAGDGCSALGKAHFYAAYPCSGVSSTVVNDGLWHQLVGVYDSTNQKTAIYVDGQFQSSSSGGNIIGAIAAPFLVGGITVGGSPVSYYTGLIDEVRLYDHALSASEIQTLYVSVQIPGGGSAKTDCLLEWRVLNPTSLPDKKGFPSTKQNCMDGDPSCDFDSTEGQCTFHLAACLHVNDPRLVDKHAQPVCIPSGVAAVDVTKANPLQEPLVALGGQAGGKCTKGKKGESCQENMDCDTGLGRGDGKCQGQFVFFDPPVDTQSCTALKSVVVPLKISPKGSLKKAALTLKTTTMTLPPADKKNALMDVDKVQLTCLPGGP